MIDYSKIVNWSIPNQTYNIRDLDRLPKNFLQIKIHQNTPSIVNCEILPNGNIEERQYSIFNQINDVCKKYEIPDLSFVYCTHDKPSFDGPFFTHARKKGFETNTILAPCFTFDSYPEGPTSNLVKYTETYDKILSNNVDWFEKIDSCVFVGHIGENNNRLDNTNIVFNNVKLELINQQASSEKFITRESLSKYKYLLHLNGNNGAYASRLKYLLGTGSLVIYNSNSGHDNNFWEEWWMNDEMFKHNHNFIHCNNKFEVVETINYFDTHQSECAEIAKNGMNFFKDQLNYENVLKFWSELLTEYSKRLNF
jgi:hypothetical protein